MMNIHDSRHLQNNDKPKCLDDNYITAKHIASKERSNNTCEATMELPLALFWDKNEKYNPFPKSQHEITLF
jgi:hypothetical protein